MGCSSIRSGKTTESAIKKANLPRPAPANAPVSQASVNPPSAQPKPDAEPPAKKPSIKQPPNPPEITPPANLSTLSKEPPSSEKTVALWLDSLYASTKSKISSNI